MKKFLKAIIFAASLISFSMSNAGADKIEAVVNNQPITSYDLSQISKMMLFLSNITHVDKQLERQVYFKARSLLINQTLVLQEAKKHGLDVKEDELRSYIAGLEEDNKAPTGYFQTTFKQQHLDYAFFENKMRADILLKKMQKTLFPEPTVNKDSIDQVIIDTSNKPNSFELVVFNSLENNDKAYKKMANLHKSLQNCSKLPIEKKYNEFANMQYITQDIHNMEPTLQATIRGMTVGQISNVIKTQQGFEIVMVCKRQIMEVSHEEVDKLNDLIVHNKMNMDRQRFFINLRKKAYVKIMGKAA
jgi:parvulin-like peptidyl-prolyl isomerase